MRHPDLTSATSRAIDLLSALIATPSVSRDEKATADIIEQWLTDNGASPRRVHNCVWAVAGDFDPSRRTLMLNSHHDTVRPAPSWTRDPFTPTLEEDRLYGLGSNDAAASAVALAEAFLAVKDKPLPFNLILALTAEEEVMGEHGMRAMLPELERCGMSPDMAIVGEPTGLQPAVAERGLVVLDCISHGRTGHAARNEGINALYKAIDDIQTLRSFRFPKESDTLGPIKISVTQIEAGRQHNVVPDECRWVVDVRTTDAYSNEETARIIGEAIEAEARPRSTRVRASVISTGHPLVRAAVELGGKPFVSPTTSDMALMPFPSLKIGPGESSRSHSADEYIRTGEISAAIDFYTQLITAITI